MNFKIKFSISFISTVLLISTLFSCCTSKDCPSYFQLNADIKNARVEYKIGDTIRIVSRFPVKVSAKTTLPIADAGEYDMTGISWKPATIIHKIDSSIVDLESKTINYIDFIYNENYNYNSSTFSSGNSRLSGEYNENSGYFDLEVVLVTKLPGTYFLCQASDLQNSFQDFDGRCSGLGFYADVILNNGDDNNIDLLKESPNPHWNTRIFEKPEERFYRKGGFCFKVVE